jgi:hypothetical protein
MRRLPFLWISDAGGDEDGKEVSNFFCFSSLGHFFSIIDPPYFVRAIMFVVSQTRLQYSPRYFHLITACLLV